MPSPTLQFKRGLFNNLPGLKVGEPGFTTDSYELYIGINSTTQENKFFGSHRYWTRETASTGSGINLVEGTTNGSDFLTLAAPANLTGITTYTFPAAPIATNVLATDANGVLSWVSSVTEFNIGTLLSGIGTFTNNVAFTTTTNNTLGNENTGAVQLDGGMGIAKNLTVKENLSVGTNLGIGTTTPTSKLWVNGDGYFVGVITANKFVGALDATFALTQSVGFATTATNLAGGSAGNVPYQSATNTTAFVTNGITGQVLISNGSGTPTWGNVSAATGSFGGISVYDEISPVGNSDSITTLKFVGGNIRATATTGASGIATITIADNLVGTALSVSGISTFSGGPVLIGAAASTGTVGQVLQVAGINSSVYIGGSVGLGTTNPTSKLWVDGDGYFVGVLTANRIFSGQYGEFVGGSISGTNVVGTSLSISGISTFTNGPVLVGTGTSTGTAGQVLQVTGINSSVYIGGSVGLGTTNPTSKLSVDGNVFVSGIITASSFRGYSALVGTASSTTTTFVVTVASKTSNHRYFGTGSANAYFIDGIESPFLTLLPGKTYRFTQEDASNSTHPILFYYQADKTTGYTTNVTTTGTPGSAGAYTEIVVTDTTPVVLHYQCSAHPYMGNAAHFNSNVVDTPHQIIARNGINVTGSVNVGTALSSPTVKTATIQHSNATNAATIDASGNITAAQNLTVSGDLFVNGSTTRVSTVALTVEDRTIDLGIVDGAAPGAATTWDLGILFNYYATTAKKSAVIWQHDDARFKFASVLAADSDGTTVNTPDLTVTTFAPIEIGGLWVNNTCTGGSQEVISCFFGPQLEIRNVVIDAGSF